ncbi:MAG: C40 family peptidase [Bacteroides sp.]|nr:C40 family peptidase [Bacteroides sp.]
MNKIIFRFLVFVLLGACAAFCGGCSTKRHSVRHKRPETSQTSKPSKKPRAQKSDRDYFAAADDRNLSRTRRDIIRASEAWLGTPYSYGSAECGRGSDCSGMVVTVYDEEAGIKLPRNSAQIADYCKTLKASQVLPGDLVFFATGKDPDRISHVGIMLDDVWFMHISSSKGGVVSDITTPYYQRTFKGFGRAPGL